MNKRINGGDRLTLGHRQHVDHLAAVLVAGGKPIVDAVKMARAIIDEVDRQVDGELEREGYKAGV